MKRAAVLRSIAFALCLLTLCAPAPKGAYAAADYAYFDDAVFLGDSLTVGLEKYAKNQHVLGDAHFLATNGYMLSQTSNEDGFSKHPEYEGHRLQPQKSIAAIKPKKVFITLGINDSAGDISTLVKNYEKLLDAIRHAVPKAKLHMIAVFPMTTRKEDSRRNNDKIDSINASLMKLAAKENITFIDFTEALKSGNSLNKSYSSDDYVHFSDEGYEVWVAQMRAFAKFAQRKSSSEVVRVVNVKSFVNARSEASSDSKLVAKIPKGTIVDVQEQCSDSWYKIEYDGKSMYVYGKYLSIGGGAELSGKVKNVSEYANLRALPSADAERSDTAEKNQTLSVSQAYYNSDWYRVFVNGESCYINKNYLELN